MVDDSAHFRMFRIHRIRVTNHASDTSQTNHRIVVIKQRNLSRAQPVERTIGRRHQLDLIMNRLPRTNDALVIRIESICQEIGAIIIIRFTDHLLDRLLTERLRKTSPAAHKTTLAILHKEKRSGHAIKQRLHHLPGTQSLKKRLLQRMGYIFVLEILYH